MTAFVRRVADERGIAMIEMIVVGFTVVALTLPTMVMVARMVEATDTAAEQARSAAVWYARHGQLPDSGGADDVVVEVDDGWVSVRSEVLVELIAIGGSAIETTVSAEFEMPISPYRSDR